MSREGALWIGGLEPYMDEAFLQNAMQLMGEQNLASIKVIKNKFTGEPASYGFINFDSDASALMAMHKLNGKIIPNSQPPVRFKLNHNSTRLMPGEKDFSVWVGDLTPDVDDHQMYKFFSARFQTVKAAKVVLDGSGFSKGYGFIRFGNEQEQQTALISMMGVSGLGGKPIKVSLAVPRAKMEGMAGIPSSLTGANKIASAPASSSITDSLPASALAAMVANASGNPNAGAAVVAEAQSQEYNAYWQQYQQQQYWSQYAAWSQYSQQQQQEQAPAQGYNGHAAPPMPQEAPPMPSSDVETTKRISKGMDMFEGDELELVDHFAPIDVEKENEDFLNRSEELWDAVNNSMWWQPLELTQNTAENETKA